MKKLLYVVIFAVVLATTASADMPWPPDCAPNCQGK